MEDVLHLVKVTKDEKTCEQALHLLRSFVSDEQKFHKLVGLDSLSDIPEGEVPADQIPQWITNSFTCKLTKQLIGMKMKVDEPSV